MPTYKILTLVGAMTTNSFTQQIMMALIACMSLQQMENVKPTSWNCLAASTACPACTPSADDLIIRVNNWSTPGDIYHLND